MGMVSPEIDSLSAKFLCWCASLLWKLLWDFVDTIKHYLQPCKGYRRPRSHARLHAAIIISHFWVTRQIIPPWSGKKPRNQASYSCAIRPWSPRHPSPARFLQQQPGEVLTPQSSVLYLLLTFSPSSHVQCSCAKSCCWIPTISIFWNKFFNQYVWI